MKRAPSFSASYTVRSAEPLSRTMISSQQRRLSMARAILRSSLSVMMVAVIFIALGYNPPVVKGAYVKQSRKIASAIQPSRRRATPISEVSYTDGWRRPRKNSTPAQSHQTHQKIPSGISAAMKMREIS